MAIDVYKKLKLEFLGIKSLISDYTDNGNVINFLNGLEDGLQYDRKDEVLYYLEELTKWYFDHTEDISENEYDYKIDAHIRNMNILSECLEGLKEYEFPAEKCKHSNAESPIINLIEDYIFKCEKCLEANDLKDAQELVKIITSVYLKDIPTIKEGLDINKNVVTVPGASVKYDYIGDIRILKEKLIAYKAELYEKDTQPDSPLIAINNNNVNDNNSNSAVSIDFKNLTNVINEIPDESICLEEKEQIEDKINAIELLLQKNDKKKAQDKLWSILKFMIEKGIDVSIALLPYLGQIADALSKM